MKRYIYYPGCSLKSTGKAYEESLLAVFQKLGLHIEELPDWNCCGATSYAAIDEMQAFSLAARNLAIAESGFDAEIHVVAPCNACYLVLLKTQKYMRDYERVRQTVERSLRAAGLIYRGTVHVRHPLDVLMNDAPRQTLAGMAVRSLKGKRIACYYGCQIVRPFAEFDNQQNPVLLDQMVELLGGEPIPWSLKTFCCGGSLTGTIPEAGLRLNDLILKEARKRNAEAIITCCPLCQFNLECFQDDIGRVFADDVHIPVVYFTQLLGHSLGLSDRELGLHRSLSETPEWSVEEGGVGVHA